MMFRLFNDSAICPFWRWQIALIGSLLLHFLVGYAYFYKKEMPLSELVASAVIVEFSDPPQSIVVSSELPVGPPQQIAQEAVEQAVENPPEMPPEAILALKEPTPPDVKPEIVVAQKESEAEKLEAPKIKAAETELVRKSKKTEPIKKPLHNKKVVQEKNAKQAPKKEAPMAEKASQAGSLSASAAPKGESNKIASNFNSSSRGSSLELNWKAQLKSHLERRLRYPEQALSKRWKGKPVIQITLDSKGNVLNVMLISASGKSSLDREAVENAKRSSPLPAPPEALLNQNRISVNVPIHFDYDTYSP